MNPIETYLSKMENKHEQLSMKELLDFIQKEYPFLELTIKWNQPMFINKGTFIIGFSYSKKHIAVALEKSGLMHFSQKIKNRGFEQSKMLFYFPWGKPIDYDLLKEMIEYNISEKTGYQTFWR